MNEFRTFAEETAAMEKKTFDLLMDVGCNPGLLGFKYLKEAVIMQVNNPKTTQQMTKVLYPDIAKKFGTTAVRVERAVRHCIESMFETTDPDTLQKYFRNSINIHKGKVTNKTFINTMANYL